MADSPWDQFLTPDDRDILAASGFGTRAGLGNRPAVIVIDATYGFCGDRPEPVLQSMARWPTSCGQRAWDTLPAMQAILAAAREKGLPVIYTTRTHRADNWDAGSWRWKVSSERQRIARNDSMSADEILPQLQPAPGDIVVTKRKPSAFFGTDLTSFLTLLHADSLIVMGGTTSGCVRATVLDAFSLNYRVTVVEDGVFDRLEASHAMSLCDMHARYADVISSTVLLDEIRQLHGGMFELPALR